MDWDARFRQQAEWTGDLRAYIYERAGLAKARRVLDLGCGTGALLNELLEGTQGEVHGLDIKYEHLEQASQRASQAGERAELTLGDAQSLPYASGSFDISLCHFVLLWVPDPAGALAELRRVTRSGGAILALAEPDYGGRIDYPEELSQIGDLQAQSLKRQGADPLLGRKLGWLFNAAGLREVESGILGAQWSGSQQAAERDLEWKVLEQDLKENRADKEIDLPKLKLVDEQAWQTGERVLFVPTFYAWGRV